MATSEVSVVDYSSSSKPNSWVGLTITSIDKKKKKNLLDRTQTLIQEITIQGRIIQLIYISTTMWHRKER